ncbi:HAMP domain-containing histidine kinase [Cereibacter changlensis]|uniref:histidine kinase n=1 Tax=Cereibacter changlensis TaxID=402884 RepID=A0A4U0Z352_9RHOB|nr:HAMP domain-containing sensor histidine kinase [Cereibacter changlensis]TKA97759.1 HAMP domain-containing histidine kinase [Cereibacter changlensis]
MMRSLRRRAILSGLALATASMGLGGVTLFVFLNTIALKRFDDAIADRHLQVVVASLTAGPDPAAIAREVAIPAYDRAYSGSYWQIVPAEGPAVTSRSLFDTLLPVPPDVGPELAFAEVEGPDGPLRIGYSRINAEEADPQVVIVGETTEGLVAERRQVRNGLAAAFGLVAALGLVSALLQTSTVLRPLSALRRDITRRWQGEETLDPKAYPSEVAPLVEDINLLIQRNRDLLDRNRRQGADLAHALRTPSAILRNELDSFLGAGVDAHRAVEALDRIDAQILRSLARIRAANVSVGSARTDVRQSADRLARLFRSMLGEGATLSVQVEKGLRVAMDAQDFEEALGNLLDNATKWSRGQVKLSAAADGDEAVVTVEDDGPGLPENAHAEALRAGGRLDLSAKGSGLGLPIARDLVEVYGGSLALGSSGLGGLCAVLRLPMRGAHGLSGKG